jgi:hypothetical protein
MRPLFRVGRQERWGLDSSGSGGRLDLRQGQWDYSKLHWNDPLLCTPSLDRPKVEFRASFHDGGLGSPSGVCSEIGDLLPIAPGGEPHCRTRLQNAHGIVFRELLYPWHPWATLRVAVHEAIGKVNGEAFRCTLSGLAAD